MSSSTVVVNLPADAEARPVAVLVQIASKYESRITITSENRKINAKSIMGMMSLTLLPGEEITVVANGTDEKEAAAGIERFLVNVKNR